MKRRARVAAALVLALAASPAAAFHRTETGTAGRCLWWAQPSVVFKLNAAAANTLGCATREAVEALATASFAAWGAAHPAGQPVCTSFAFSPGGRSASQVIGFDPRGPNENVVIWRVGRCADIPATDPCHDTPGACADQHNCWDYPSTQTIGLTTTNYRPDTGEILDADMELFDRSVGQSSGFWFTCANPTPTVSCGSVGTVPNPPTTSCVSMDLGSTVTHEAGHMLGLAHPCQSPNTCAAVAGDTTMFGTASIGQTTKRILKDDDIQGVCTIYPAGGAPQPAGGTGDSGTTCGALPPPDSGSSGCGCGHVGAGDLALLAALAGLARAMGGRSRASTPPPLRGGYARHERRRNRSPRA